MIAYRDGAGEAGADELAPFFVGWPSPPTPERRVEMLRGSDVCVLAYDGERLVGFVTAVTDGVFAGYVPLLEVLPEYQARGIGSELVRRALEHLEGLYMVDLACDEELVGFYERLGLRRVGAAMGLRRLAPVPAAARAQAFDDVLIVDWSASSRPKSGSDSVWIGHVSSTSSGDASNLPTRGQAVRVLTDRLVELVRAGRRVLVGFDFPYGYPRGTAVRLGLADAEDDDAWLRLWEELRALIADGPTNANNRYEVAAALNARGACFWGKPSTSTADVPARKQPFTLPEFRSTEEALRSSGRQPKSAWQLTGAGSVGSQALVGIPALSAVRFDPRLVDVSRVWPFETGFELPRDVAIVHAEIWPGVIVPDANAHEVADARQVISLARHFHAMPERELARVFAPSGGDDAARREEGWILGAV